MTAVFQGGVTPADTLTVRLGRVSAVQWMWVSHLIWGGIWIWYAVCWCVGTGCVDTIRRKPCVLISK